MTLTDDQRKIVEENLGLVGKVIKDRVHGINQMGIFDYHDLFQIGSIGLCKAAATDKGGNFSTYAYRLIWNEICDALIYATKRQSTELQLLEGTGTGSASDPLMQILLRAEVHAGIQRARPAADVSGLYLRRDWSKDARSPKSRHRLDGKGQEAPAASV